MGGTLNIRYIGGLIIWIINGFKIPLKDCVNNYISAFLVGIITILIVSFTCIYFWK